MKIFWGYIAVIASMFFWAFSFIWSKGALEFYNPFTILSSRLIIASVVLMSFSKLIGKLNKIEKGDFKYLILLSFFEPFLYFIGETFGLQRVSPTIAAVMIATIPVFLPYAAWIFFKERITKYKVGGTLLSFMGVILVIVNNQMQLNADFWGIALLILAVFSAIGYTSLVKNLSEKYNAFTIVSWQSLFGLVGFLPLFFLFEFKETSSIGFVWEGFLPIIFLAIFGSIMAFVLFTHSIKVLGVTKSGVFGNAIPVLTSLFSFLLLGERLLGINYIGILIVVIGLFISQLQSKKPSK
jgi:drug/metabolite transporter (DMT)-like permease